MANTLDYSKLSKATLEKIANNEELDYSTLPKSDLEEIAKMDEPSVEGSSEVSEAPKKSSTIDSILSTLKDTGADLGAAGIGAGQGLTFGFGDDLWSGGRALVSDKTYEEIRPETEAFMNEIKDKYKKSYYAGEIGAGLAFNPLGKTIGAGASLLPKLTTAVVPKLGKVLEKVPVTSRVAQNMLQGTAFGGLLGAGEATSTENTFDKALEGAKSGAAFGGILGLGGEVVNKLTPGIVGHIKDSAMGELVSDILTTRKQGYDHLSKQSTKDLITRDLRDKLQEFGTHSSNYARPGMETGLVASEMTGSLPDIRHSLGKELSDIVDESVKRLPNFKVEVALDDFSDIVNNIPTILGPTGEGNRRVFNKILQSLKMGIVKEDGTLALTNNVFDADTASRINSQLSAILNGQVSGLKIEDPFVKTGVKKLKTLFQAPLEDAVQQAGLGEKYASVKRAFQDVADTQKTLGLEKSYFQNNRVDANKAADQLLSKASKLTSEGSLTGYNFDEDLTYLQKLIDSPDFQQLPEKIQNQLNKSRQMIGEIKNLSIARDVAQQARTTSPPDSGITKRLMNSYRANVIEGISSMMDLKTGSKKFVDSIITPEGTAFIGKQLGNVKRVADTDVWFNKLSELSKSKGNEELSKTIDYIAQQDMGKRRALTFVLMQQPKIRSLLNENKETEK